MAGCVAQEDTQMPHPASRVAVAAEAADASRQREDQRGVLKSAPPLSGAGCAGAGERALCKRRPHPGYHQRSARNKNHKGACGSAQPGRTIPAGTLHLIQINNFGLMEIEQIRELTLAAFNVFAGISAQNAA